MRDIKAIQAAVVRCRRCPELRAYTAAQVAREKKRAYRDCSYWGKPVPAFGDPHARVVLVGLAPGAHGSNRTGRPFTGDASGDFLYPALFRAGFASRPGRARPHRRIGATRLFYHRRRALRAAAEQTDAAGAAQLLFVSRRGVRGTRAAARGDRLRRRSALTRSSARSRSTALRSRASRSSPTAPSSTRCATDARSRCWGRIIRAGRIPTPAS